VWEERLKGKEKKRKERKAAGERKMGKREVALLLLFEMRAYSGRKGTFSVLLLFLLMILILPII